jgi:hypothetical protein
MVTMKVLGLTRERMNRNLTGVVVSITIVLLLSRLLDAVSRYDVMIRHNQWFLVGVTFKA